MTSMGFPVQAGTLVPLHPVALVPAPVPPSGEEKEAGNKQTKKDDKSMAKGTCCDKRASSGEHSVARVDAERHSSSASESKSSIASNDRGEGHVEGRLARLTAYWASEGDYYTSHGISSTGIHLHDGYCAVDPRIIPYGSVVTVAGVGKYLAVDTGSAVISREAARETGHTPEERSALVIDIYFESRADGEQFAASGPKFAAITWKAPNQANSMTTDVRSMVAESEWNKLRNKQLTE